MPSSLYMDQCITVVGTVSLQQYIFRSNRLKENIGASYLVTYWLDQGLIDTLRNEEFLIETSAWEAYKAGVAPAAPAGATTDGEVIYVGGGNAALLFQTRERAQQAIGIWSKKVLEEATGLRVAVGYGEVKTSLVAAYKEALRDLEACENGLPFGASLLALPVVRTCTSTGLPAVTQSDEEGDWISREASSKRKQVGMEYQPGPAQQSIAQAFRTTLAAPERFAVQLDELGGREGESHIAVVHADGNGVGKLLTTVVARDTVDDAAFLHDVREFSASVARLAFTAFQQTLRRLKSALSLDRLTIRQPIFPIRPIVYGGDDLTFVCDGRLGLELAAVYLQEFAQGKITVAGAPQAIDACAGVAIVPTKFPFARAYAFAEELCTLAKKKRQERKQDGSWLDFHISLEGATGSIDEVRQHQYRTLTGQQLYQRPYNVLEDWGTFVNILRHFRTWPRSRAKGLLQALVQGPGATQRFVAGAHWRQYMLPNPRGIDANASREGWTGGGAQSTTPYFDPLEALDFYLDGIPFSLEAASEARAVERMAP